MQKIPPINILKRPLHAVQVPPQQPDQHAKKASVLIIDDEADILRVLKAGLEAGDCSTYGFVNPVAALEHFRQNPENYQVVISDVRMPQMSGFELAKEIRRINPDVKIILMTAFEINMSEFKKVMPSMRVDALLSKPLHLDALKTAIKSLNG